MSIVLFGLWLVWAALLFGGWLFGKPAAPGGQRLPTWARMGSSGALTAAAVMFAVSTPGQPILWLVALGMGLGLLGDLFMARLIVRGERYVFSGIAAFGLGHIAYLAALLADHDALGLPASSPSWPVMLAGWVLGAGVWFLLIWRPARQRTGLHVAALIYALLLSSTLGAATSAALAVSAYWPVALGALLFLLSDLILAAGLFNGLRFRGMDDVVWLTYGPGQMLIVFGMGLALTT